MEQDCVAGVYGSVGLCAGAEFSSEDVSLVYSKVFHVPSDAEEAHAAMMKTAGGNGRWSCVGEKLLDVLVEMEKERERKEKLYWDQQLFNVGEQDSGRSSFQTEERDEVCRSLRGGKRLERAARRSWSRLASEGVHSLLPPQWRCQSLKVRGQAWGCVSPSDVLLLVDVKYDIMSNLLFSEMLQEHHTPAGWEALLTWQRHKEEERLEDLAEEALGSGDMLGLAELPGAFRIYRARLGSSQSCREVSCSAASFLVQLQTSRRQEREEVKELADRLDGDGLKLLCLQVRLAIVRAQRETLSYRALLAAGQSWDSWPHVNSPSGVEQVAMLLHDEDEEDKEELISASPQQQALLQLLVLTQGQERKHLVKLMRRVSLGDVQGPGCRVSQREDDCKRTLLRNGCIETLKQILLSLGTHREASIWSEQQLEDCSLILLSRLLELHHLQASALLQAMVNQNVQHLQLLQEQYESKLQTEGDTSLLHLLISDPTTRGSTEEHTAEPCSSGGAVKVVRTGPPQGLAAAPINGERNRLQTAAEAPAQDVCSDCGTVTEEMPYLEILCVSDAASRQETGGGGGGGGGGGDAEKGHKTMEKQGSLITQAWSQPPEGHGDDGAAADGSQNENTQCEGSSGRSHDVDEKPTSLQSGSRESAEEQLSTDGQANEGGGSVSVTEIQRFIEPPDLGPTLVSEGAEAGEDVDGSPVETEMWTPEETAQTEETPTSQKQQDAERKAQREPMLTEREREREPVSALEREKTIRNLVDMQKKVEQRQMRERERQLLRVQERLAIMQSRKAERDLLGLKHSDRLRHLTEDLPQDDKNQQKTVVKERLDQLRRERSYILQSKRDRNTAVFKELLAPVAVHGAETEDGTN